MIVLAVLAAFAVAAGLTRQFCDPASRLHILDHPNERSLHSRPIPRSGGVAILGGILVGGMLAYTLYPVSGEIGILLISAAPVILISFLDDRFGINPGIRILVHFLAAIVLLGAGYGPDSLEMSGTAWIPPPGVLVSVLILFVVWMINLYNFMDGIDGLAGGMAVIGFVTFAILGRDNGLFASASLLIAGAVGGFLLFNFPPARIFLGDTGSSFLGLLVAAFSLWASRDGLFSLWVAVLIFSPFVVDASVTLLRRLAHGERIWRPHKTHYYQRLVQVGWGHRRTVLAEYVLMLSCSLSALVAVHMPVGIQTSLLVTWLLIYVFLMVGIQRLERHCAKVTAS